MRNGIKMEEEKRRRKEIRRKEVKKEAGEKTRIILKKVPAESPSAGKLVK